jgi:hypothetical protein
MNTPTPIPLTLPPPEGEPAARFSDALLAIVLHGLTQAQGSAADGAAAVRIVRDALESRRRAVKAGYWP